VATSVHLSHGIFISLARAASTRHAGGSEASFQLIEGIIPISQVA
jgi:hypothetical protein